MVTRILGPLTPRWKFLIDICLWSIAAPLALFARVDVRSLEYVQPIAVYTVASLLVKIPLVYSLRLHHQRWRIISIRDLDALLRAIGIGTIILFVVFFLEFPLVGLPRSIPLIEGVIAVVMLGGARLTNRLFHERIASGTFHETRKRVLIVGAGDTGSTIAREMSRHPESGFDPIGFLDDDPHKRQDRFRGLPVLGDIEALLEVVRKVGVDQILIAMPSASGDVIRKVVEQAASVGVTYRIIPAYHEILSGKVSISQIREVDVEDLLRRQPIKLNTADIASYLNGKVVLVTGAGGSIGSEIVRQVAYFQPAKIILVDHYETGMYYLEREFENTFPSLSYSTVIADIQRKEKLEQVFETYAPQVVFHAAAHKHVPMMESNPDEAVLNNVGGTENVLEASITHGVERFVNISTDKAVKPTSIMGACKRVAEYLVQSAASRAGAERVYVSVRFGNVLGSQGSVIPVFKEQIRHGGPVTVTHPDMVRYFMTISEAAQLVLQAGGLGQTGVVYILDMGEPVKIVDLAHDLIRLSGLSPDKDIKIAFTGVRPGEKLFEQLLTDREGVEVSKYEAILIAPQNGSGSANLKTQVERLYTAASAQDYVGIKTILKEMIPSYQIDDHLRQI